MNLSRGNANENIFCLFCAEKSGGFLLREFSSYDKDYQIIRNINDACFIINSSKNDITARIKESPPVFIRQMFPVQIDFRISGDEGAAAVAEKLGVLFRHIKDRNNLSVQIKAYDNTNIPQNELRDLIHEKLSKAYIQINIKDPVQVLSSVIDGSFVYAGISYCRDNLSRWTAGEYRFKFGRDQVNRAEFKLMEAIMAFGIKFPEKGFALDIGASPGGWTRVLLKNRLHVTAVDPAELDQRLLKNPFLEYRRLKLEEFLKINRRKYDLIANDMKADPKYTIGILRKIMPLLRKNGIIISTLKLPKNADYESVMKMLNAIKRSSRLIGARQLFHNRNEITFAVKAFTQKNKY